MGDPVIPLERNLYGRPLTGLLWERQFQKVLWERGWEKVPHSEFLFVNREKGLFLSVYVDDMKLTGKNQNIDPMWKVLVTEVDLGEPTSLLDHVFLSCTQRECESSKDIVEIYRNMLESRIFAEAEEKLPCSRRLDADISSWSCDMEDHAKKWVERYCELANKATQQLHKVGTSFMVDHQFREEEIGLCRRIFISMLSSCPEMHASMTTTFKRKKWKSVVELSQVCSQIVMKYVYLARIGKSDILWSVIKLVRAVAKWTRACDKRLSRLISYFHHTCGYKQYCHVGNTAKQCKLGLFQDSDFAGDLEDSKSTSGGTLCIFGSHLFVHISWMCKKQTSVSHCSTESEIISLDAGLCMDSIPALDLWDLVTEVLHSFSNQSKKSTENVQGNLLHDHHQEKKLRTKLRLQLSPTILSYATSIVFPQTWSLPNPEWSRWSSREEVPTMRHVFRTHRVAIDWWFDRINLDTKIQIKYVDTKKTTRRHTDKGNFHTWWVEPS